MQQQNPENNKKEPLKLKVILPLVGLIVILTGAYFALNLSKESFADTSVPELIEDFHTSAVKKQDYDHYKLFVGQKPVTWEHGASLEGFLNGLEGSENISSVSLNYQIPVFINLAGDWIFNISGQTLSVQAPMPTFGDAVLDPNSLQIKFKNQVSTEEEGLIRETLKESLASYRVTLDNTSRTNLEKESRIKVEELVSTWLKKTYSNVPDLKYQVSFSGSENTEATDEP
jgi:hypothetical protein